MLVFIDHETCIIVMFIVLGHCVLFFCLLISVILLDCYLEIPKKSDLFKLNVLKGLLETPERWRDCAMNNLPDLDVPSLLR